MARIPKPSGVKSGFGQPRNLSDSRKPVGSRTYQKQIVIVVEGTKTERLYFDALIRDFHIQTVKVSIVDSHGKTAPTQIVEKAIEKREELRNRQEWEEDNDEIWCVFDTEDGSNELGLTEAYSKATNEVINLAISNPSFEYWYLLHYKDTDRVYPNCASLISELRRHLKGYEKNIQIYPKIRKKLPNAFQNAHLVRTRNLPAWTSRMNPSTGVDILVGVVKTLHDKKMQVA